MRRIMQGWMAPSIFWVLFFLLKGGAIFSLIKKMHSEGILKPGLTIFLKQNYRLEIHVM
jgi:hypothetical protein